MTLAEAAIGAGIGFVSGILAGLFGVGGGIVMTPGVQVLLGAPAIVARAPPRPPLLPTAKAGAAPYARRGDSALQPEPRPDRPGEPRWPVGRGQGADDE